MLNNHNSMTLPLHTGHPPAYLIRRMTSLSKAICTIFIKEFGTIEFLKRISDPLWFQAFGCVLGFDWHSSGVTTVVMGVLKQSLSANSHGIIIAGGKGKKSRQTLKEIETGSQNEFNLSDNKINSLLYASRMSAKIDNSAIQDSYSLYHHNILFDQDGNWSVVQQGLYNKNNTARRYHWFSKALKNGFTAEPHSGIIGDQSYSCTLDMTSSDSIENQKTSIDLVKNSINYDSYVSSINQLFKKKDQCVLDAWFDCPSPMTLSSSRIVPNHNCQNTDYKPSIAIDTDNHYSMPRKVNWDIFKRIYEIQPSSYEELLDIRGVGATTVRSLSLIGELIYGTKSSWKDPVKFCFAHGGKDGVPFYVDRKSYDSSIAFLDSAIESASISRDEKLEALKKLSIYNSRIYSLSREG
ncbi:MAG: DUF763 domain-containing protein [Thermoproteota archaeon]|nr:DUF763 domain-containing protein [Thermoproteota archaeon]